MTAHKRYVVDSNLLVSRMLAGQSRAGLAVHHAMQTGSVLFSAATFAEFADVLMRPKFDPYVSVEDRRNYITLIRRSALWIEILRPIQACRDPKDDKILETAVNGNADAIITGDKDLLVLHPFLGIPIISPADFLSQFSI
jgi:uncharacterized protein